jgi:hypothetical protein
MQIEPIPDIFHAPTPPPNPLYHLSRLQHTPAETRTSHQTLATPPSIQDLAMTIKSPFSYTFEGLVHKIITLNSRRSCHALTIFTASSQLAHRACKSQILHQKTLVKQYILGPSQSPVARPEQVPRSLQRDSLVDSRSRLRRTGSGRAGSDPSHPTGPTPRYRLGPRMPAGCKRHRAGREHRPCLTGASSATRDRVFGSQTGRDRMAATRYAQATPGGGPEPGPEAEGWASLLGIRLGWPESAHCWAVQGEPRRPRAPARARCEPGRAGPGST